jgi:transcriptional regulator with XRE-family HTH domain
LLPQKPVKHFLDFLTSLCSTAICGIYQAAKCGISKNGGIVMSVVSFDLLDEQMTEDDKMFYKQLGQRVLTLRKEMNLTQVQLCKLLGISQQLLANQESGQRRIPASMLPKLATILNVSFEELLGTKKSPAKRGPVSALNRQVEQIRLLPRTKQKFVMEMLDTVIRQQGS